MEFTLQEKTNLKACERTFDDEVLGNIKDSLKNNGALKHLDAFHHIHVLEVLHDTLEKAKNAFFTNIDDIDAKKFSTFQKKCIKAVNKAGKSFEERPGLWNDVFVPIIRTVIGVFALIASVILVVPIVWYVTDKDVRTIFNGAFFKKPQRNPEVDNAWKALELKEKLLNESEPTGVFTDIKNIIKPK